MERKTLLGIAGVLGIGLTAGFALPFASLLMETFTPEQLMVFRGFITAAIALVLLKGKVLVSDRYTYLIAVTVPFATWGMFQGIRHWGPASTLIVIAATPVVNVAIGIWLGRRISLASFVGLILVLGGITMALWNGRFQWKGFLWSLFGTLVAGVVNEWIARSKAATPLQRCFWGSMGMGTWGLIVALAMHTSWSAAANLSTTKLLLIFAFIGGFLYWLSYLLTFDNLPTTEACILAQSETLTVIVGASLMLGDRLSWFQWSGVGIALIGVSYLLHWLTRRSAVEGN